MTDDCTTDPNWFEAIRLALRDPDTLMFAFWLSVGLLAAVSLLKYFICHPHEKSEWGFLFLEIPIDVCVVVITVLITGYMRSIDAEGNSNMGFGMILVVASLVVAIICCIFRRLSIDRSYVENKGKRKLTYLFGFLDMGLACGWIYIIYDYIICSRI